MGIYVTVERWERGSPVLRKVKLVHESGIEISMELENFLSKISEEIGSDIATTMTASGLNKKLNAASDKVTQKLKDATVVFADFIK
jgi:hypothetical protein